MKMHGPARSLSILIACLSLAGGCFPKAQGVQLERRTDDLDRRIGDLEEGAAQERAELRAQLERAQEKVVEIESVLQQATDLLTRNSADLGQEVRTLREDLMRIDGEIAEVRNALDGSERRLDEAVAGLDARLNRLARQAGVDITLDPSEIPADRAEHYGAAYRAFQDGDHGRARALFRAFVEKYPQDDEADNAQYWIGKSYLVQDDPSAALRELRVVIGRHARADAADEALLDMADAFFRLNACTDAKAALDALIQGYPRSPLLPQARRLAREIDRAPRGRCAS